MKISATFCGLVAFAWPTKATFAVRFGVLHDYRKNELCACRVDDVVRARPRSVGKRGKKLLVCFLSPCVGLRFFAAHRFQVSKRSRRMDTIDADSLVCC